MDTRTPAEIAYDKIKEKRVSVLSLSGPCGRDPAILIHAHSHCSKISKKYRQGCLVFVN